MLDMMKWCWISAIMIKHDTPGIPSIQDRAGVARRLAGVLGQNSIAAVGWERLAEGNVHHSLIWIYPTTQSAKKGRGGLAGC